MLIVAKVFFWILGIMFFAGAIGSALVVILTAIDDVRELRANGEEEKKSMGMPQPMAD